MTTSGLAGQSPQASPPTRAEALPRCLCFRCASSSKSTSGARGRRPRHSRRSLELSLVTHSPGGGWDPPRRAGGRQPTPESAHNGKQGAYAGKSVPGVRIFLTGGNPVWDRRNFVSTYPLGTELPVRRVGAASRSAKFVPKDVE